MEKSLNEIKKEIFDTVYQINEQFDVENSTSRIIFFFGIKAIRYINTNTYSIKDIYEETYKEISNRYLLNLLEINLKELSDKKKTNPDLRLLRNRK